MIKINYNLILPCFGILLGLIFHYQLSFFDFGAIPSLSEYSFLSILSSIIFFSLLLFVCFNPNFNLINFLLTSIIFFPSIYIFRFGIFDEIIPLILLVAIFLKKNNNLKTLKIKRIDLLIALYIILLATLGFFYSIKSFRFLMQGFSVFALFLLVNSLKDNFNPVSFRNNFVKIALFYYSVVIVSHLITISVAPNFILYLHGLGFSPTTWVNVPTLFVVPYLSYLYKNSKVNFFYFLTVFILSFIVVILSDSRTGFVPFILTLPFLLPKIGFKKSLFSLLLIIISSAIIGFIQFGNYYWLYDNLENLTNIFVFGGANEFNYYGNNYQSNVGDTGRFIFFISSFINLFEQPLNFIFGSGFYSFFFINYDLISDLLISTNSSLDIPSLSLGIVGESSLLSLPRPPTLGILITEFGFIFTVFVLYRIFFLIKSTKDVFFRLFFIILIGSSIFLEISESLFFFLILSETRFIKKLI